MFEKKNFGQLLHAAALLTAKISLSLKGKLLVQTFQK